MAADPPPAKPEPDSPFARAVKTKAARKLNTQLRGPGDVWFGLGMSGLVGWSVAVPALAGALLGIWLDRHYASKHSWTLILLVGGLFLGCVNTWRWMARQNEMLNEAAKTKDSSHE